MKKIARYFLTVALIITATLPAPAQKGVRIAVTGTVTDEAGSPLPAVTVFQRERLSNGTQTDSKGRYQITLPSDAELVFSSLGFSEKTVKVAGKTTIDVRLEDESLALDAAEVVSVGYGSVAKRDLTGSVAKVDMDEIRRAPVVNFDQAIQGRVAGVVITTADGALGEDASIIIRGNNSLTQSSEPLFIIDGFPSESSFATSINPEDIESIDVLKDASATAIYGARGANGVVVITTKSGKEGRPEVKFSASWSVSRVANKLKLLDAYEFVDLQTEIAESMGSSNMYLSGGYTLEDYRNAQTVDWQDLIYRDAPSQNYSISLSGGNKAAGNRYSAVLSTVDMQGIILKSSFQRYQGKFSFNQKIGKNLEFSMKANYSRTVTNGTTPTSAQVSGSESGWLMYSVWGYRPTVPLSNLDDADQLIEDLVDESNGDLGDNRFNPVVSVRNEYKKKINDILTVNGGLEYAITPELKLKVTGGYTDYKLRNETFNNTRTRSGFPGSKTGKGINGSITFSDRTEWLNENTLTWAKTLAKKHRVNALAGLTFQGQHSSYQGTSATHMTTEALGLAGLHTGEYQVVTPYEREWSLMSWLARVNYSYNYTYYLTASFRADGSSKFPARNRWGFFPSASAAWNFNREKFLKSAKRWLSNGKVRLSWGRTGNNRTSTPYDFYSIITTTQGSTSTYDYVFDGNIVAGYYPSNMANSTLRWETTAQTDLGLDLGFFDNRIKFTGDIYQKNTYDLLFNATLPASSGYTSAMLNIGSMRNRGLELTFDLVPVRRNGFEWAVNFNIAFNRNKVTALNNNQYSLLSKVSWASNYNGQYAYITQVGMPSGLMYGYIYEGTYKEDEIDGNGLKDGVAWLNSLDKSLLRPGDPKYADINGDGTVDDDDRTVIGCGQPVHTGGFSNTFNYKGFDLGIFFQWSYGNDILNANRLILEDPAKRNLNQFHAVVDRYNSVVNPDSNIPRANAQGMNNYSSRVIEDGSFLRLRNVSLGYTIPAKLLMKARIRSARVSVSAQNLLTLTSYSGSDPEVNTKKSVLTPGFDYSAYARARGLSASVNLTF